MAIPKEQHFHHNIYNNDGNGSFYTVFMRVIPVTPNTTIFEIIYYPDLT